MKVIFDFDDVLFNAGEFKRRMFTLLQGKGYTDVARLYEVGRMTGSSFALRDFITTLDFSLSDDEREDLYQEILSLCKNCNNEDVVELARSLGKDSCYIVTSGNEEFQMDKIRGSIGLDVATTIIVVSGSKSEIIEKICQENKGEDIIFVDDRVHFFADIDMKSCHNLKTILFNEYGLENLKTEIRESQKNRIKKDGC